MRELFLKTGIILVALAFLTQPTAASLCIESPQTVVQGEKIVVTVTKEDGEPVRDVFLQFTIDEGTPIYAVTNESGKAVFKPEITGTLKIVAIKDGLMRTCVYVDVIPVPTPVPTPSLISEPSISYWWSGSVTLPSGTFTKTAFDTGRVYTIPWWTALGALQRTSEVGGFSYEVKETDWGPFVHSIAGKKTGDEGKMSGWMYQVNGVVPMVGAHEYPVKVGDEIIWYFAKSMETTPSVSSMVVRIKIVDYYTPVDRGILPTPILIPAPVLVEEVKKIELIEAGVNASIRFEKIDITRIIINAAKIICNAEIRIQPIEAPTNITPLDGIPYCYFNVTTTNVTDMDIADATIEFKVNKTWINEHNIDERTITLNRYRDINNTWTALPTSKIGEDNISVYFESKTPGLSLFAISGKPAPTPPAPPAPITPSPATPTPAPELIAPPTPPTPTVDVETAMKRIIMITVGIVLLLSTVLIAYFISTLRRGKKG